MTETLNDAGSPSADTAKPRKAKREDPPTAMLEHDLVMCEDGPRAGSWYFTSHGTGSWTELRRLARVHGETEHDGRTLGYVPHPTERATHRTWPEISARVLLWAPDLATQARERHEAGQSPAPTPVTPAEHARQRARATTQRAKGTRPR